MADENLEDALFDEEFVAPVETPAAAPAPADAATGKEPALSAPAKPATEGKAPKSGEEPPAGDQEFNEDGTPKEPAAAGDGDKMVPKKALDAARKKERETAERLQRLEAAEAARQAEAAKADIPDPIKEPVKHAQYLQRQQTMALINERLNTSETLAREKHGDEKVEAMMEWAKGRFDADVEFAKSIFAQPHPYGAAMKAFEEAEAAKTPNDHGDPAYAAFLAFQASQNGQNPTTPPADGSTPAPVPPAPKAPLPKSIAAAPSAGGPHGSVVVKDPFESEFGS